MTSNDANAWVPLFDDEVSFILETVVRCGAKLRKRHDGEHENKISDRLRMLLDSDAKFRDSGITVAREFCVYESGREEPLGRLDFWFLGRSRRGSEPYFAIETKRLHFIEPSGKKSGVADYVGGGARKDPTPQGMMCFIVQKYARGQACAAMIGYVFDGNIKRARAAIASTIRANEEQLTQCPPCKVMRSEIRGILESKHTLACGTAMVIYHCLMAVRTQAAHLGSASDASPGTGGQGPRRVRLSSTESAPLRKRLTAR